MTSPDHLRQLLNQGRYLEARSESEKLISNSDDLVTKQIHALALSKSGTPQAAAEFFGPIHQQHPDDAETAGIMGGIYKELFRQTQSQKFALLSRDAYLNNFAITHNHYTGINAATMSAIAGKFQRGREIAGEVLNGLPESSTDFWELASKAEAKLLNKDPRAAADLYLKAHKLAGSDWGKINIVYNQLWMLNHYMLVPGEILKTFSPPNVAVLVGHMIDHPNRTVPRFPAQYAQTVKDTLTGIVKSLNVRIGYTSLACGSDILFAEVIQESSGELNLFLPFKKDDFLDTSVRFAGEEWVRRFEKVTEGNIIHDLTRESYLGNDDLFSFHGRVLFGLAILRGRMLHAEPYLITVLSEWDRALKEGGTRDLLKLWPFPTRVQNIDPSKFLSSASTQPEKPSADHTTAQPGRRVAYLAAISFQGPILNEAHRLAKKMESELAQEMIALNVDGETVSAGFTSSYRAISFCKNLITDIERKSPQTKYKVGLHVGPVVVQQLDDKKTMTGTHTEILTGIFALAAPGSIYASEPFAASLVLDSGSYSFIHTGTVQLNEPLGAQNVYRVDWAASKS